VALLAGLPLVPESKDPNATPLDPLGALLSIAGLTALVYGIIEAPDNGWTDATTMSAFAVAVVLLVVFVVWELRTDHPMLQMNFFSNPRFSAASVAITLIFFALFGAVFVLTQHLQFVLGYSALEAGLRIVPFATLVLAAPMAARVVERIGIKAVVAAGLTIAGLGLALIANVDPGDGYAPIGWSLALIGFGMGATMAPATDSIMGSLPLAKAGVGSAMNDTTRMVGGALGVAVIGSALASSYGSAIEPAAKSLPPTTAAVAGDSVGAGLEVARRMGPAAGEFARAVRRAFVDAMGDALVIAVSVVAFGALIVLVWLPSRSTPSEVASDRLEELLPVQAEGS
jgi:hypothetical protein